jgi:hypothetical protein
MQPNLVLVGPEPRPQWHLPLGITGSDLYIRRLGIELVCRLDLWHSPHLHCEGLADEEARESDRQLSYWLGRNVSYMLFFSRKYLRSDRLSNNIIVSCTGDTNMPKQWLDRNNHPSTLHIDNETVQRRLSLPNDRLRDLDYGGGRRGHNSWLHCNIETTRKINHGIFGPIIRKMVEQEKELRIQQHAPARQTPAGD